MLHLGKPSMCLKHRNHHRSGYTLIEVMIALSVFAIIATMTSSVMYHVFDVRARVALHANQLDELQLVMTLLGHDTTQLIPRTVRANDSRVFSAFTGTYQYLEFTRGGLVNPNSTAKRSTLKRVAYLCKSQQLIRRSWESLDTPERNSYEDKILLKDLKTCSLAYVSRSHQVLSEWRAAALEKDQKAETIPVAIQLIINPFDWGKMTLLFVLPEGIYV